MENVDEQLKINIRSILCSISEDTVNGIIHALKYAGLETVSDLQFAQEEDLILVLKPIPRRKLIKAWSKQNLAVQTNLAIVAEDQQASSKKPSSSDKDLAVQKSLAIPAEDGQASSKNPSSSDKELPVQPIPTTPAEDGQASSSKNPNSSHEGFSSPKRPNVLPPPKIKWRQRHCHVLLEIFSKYKTEFSCPDECQKWKLWQKIADEFRKKNYDASSCCNKIEELRLKYEIIKSKSTINEAEYAFLKEAGKAFEINENSVFSPPNLLPPLKFKWKRKKCLALLKIFAKYKTQFLCADEGQKLKMWGEIANEINKKYSSNFDALSCCNKIEELKDEYETIKSKSLISPIQYAFLQEAKEAFETNENSGISDVINVKVLWTWDKKRSICLLQIYAKYKAELSCPEVQEQEVWKKIALEVRTACFITCNEVQCHNRINEMKLQYEAIKNGNVKARKKTKFIAAARTAFETTENSDNFSAEKSTSPLLPEFYCKLLQIYSKYKIEFAHPDTEEQKVWEKIARELREKFSYHCTESSCRYIFSQLKSQYENLRKDCIKSETMLYFLEKAQKAFETAENHDTPDCPVDEVNKKVGKYIPPHMRNGGYEPGKFFSIKVKNLSEDVQESDLHDLFRSFGGTIPHHICIMLDISDHSKYVAIIKFVKKEDAARAILDADGIEYNKQILKVEWAEPLQTN